MDLMAIGIALHGWWLDVAQPWLLALSREHWLWLVVAVLLFLYAQARTSRAYWLGYSQGFEGMCDRMYEAEDDEESCEEESEPPVGDEFLREIVSNAQLQAQVQMEWMREMLLRNRQSSDDLTKALSNHIMSSQDEMLSSESDQLDRLTQALSTQAASCAKSAQELLSLMSAAKSSVRVHDEDENEDDED